MINKKLALMAIPSLAVLMIVGTFAPAAAGDTSFGVTIDIKPGSDPNSINPSSNGVIPVAILGMDDWDVFTVDPTSLVFTSLFDAIGPTTLPNSNVIGFGYEDVNDDGYMDLVAHFPTQTTWINCNTTEGALSGAYLSGQYFMGIDSINPIGKDESGKCQ